MYFTHYTCNATDVNCKTGVQYIYLLHDVYMYV